MVSCQLTRIIPYFLLTWSITDNALKSKLNILRVVVVGGSKGVRGCLLLPGLCVLFLFGCLLFDLSNEVLEDGEDMLSDITGDRNQHNIVAYFKDTFIYLN